MPAIPGVGQYTQDEKDQLEQWADEVGIGMDQLADQILQMTERAVERRSAARRAVDAATLRGRLRREGLELVRFIRPVLIAGHGNISLGRDGLADCGRADPESLGSKDLPFRSNQFGEWDLLHFENLEWRLYTNINRRLVL